jgi:hypothetical protein
MIVGKAVNHEFTSSVSVIQANSRANPAKRQPIAIVVTNIPWPLGLRNTSMDPIPSAIKIPPDQRSQP